MRWLFALRHWRSLVTLRSHSVEVEQYLFDAARGKKPLPTKEQLRFIALYLGDPHMPRPSWLK